MPEVVTNGVDGFTVPPNNAAAIREKRHVLDKFSWGAVVDRCLEVYWTLL
jgi:hypothetical protein